MSTSTKRGSRKFVDWLRVRVSGGRGGDGCTSFRREAHIRYGGPDGGNGGNGGNIVFVANSNVRTLGSLRNRYWAENGSHGKGSKRNGRNGNNMVVKVPLGTVLKINGDVIADLSTNGQTFTAAFGGRGGMGNTTYVTPTFQRPRVNTEGEQGEDKILEVEMKTIADVGLVGFPNVGKSTLLRVISRARPAVGCYPFTTLNPHVGIVKGPNDTRIAVADIPGLLPGAHNNYGLGHSFLRHIERCHSLMYVLDGGLDLYHQMMTLEKELSLYKSCLASRVKVIIVNKMDLEGSDDLVRKLSQQTLLPIMPVSCLEQWNIDHLKSVIYKFVLS